MEGPEAGNAAYGRLEIFSGGGWVPVCDSTAATERFGTSEVLPEAAASVACRQLGFAGGEKAVAVCPLLRSQGHPPLSHPHSRSLLMNANIHIAGHVHCAHTLYAW